MRRAARGGVLLVLALAAGGCWDYRDINDRSLVLGMAVDAAPDHGHAVTVELASPGAGAAPAGAGPGGGGRMGGGGGPSFGGRSLMQAVAGTSSHALGQARGSWSRLWEFGHLSVWLLGEEYARRGEKDEYGCPGCHPAMNTGLYLLVARGRGADFLTAPPPEGAFAAVYLSTLVRNASERGVIPHINRVGEFVAAMQEGGVALAPQVTWEGGRPRAAGAAVFRDYRLIGWLDEEATLGVSFLQGRGSHTTLEVPCPPLPVGGSRPPGLTTVEVMGRRSRLELERRDGAPALRYLISATAMGWDAGCPRAPGPGGVSPEEERLLARETEDAIRRLALRAVARQRDLGADFLGWGVYLRRLHPGIRRTLGDEEAVLRLPVTVEVRVRVTRHSRFH